MGPAYWDLPVGGVVDKFYLFYFGQSQPSYRVIDVPTTGHYRVEILDTWNMTVTPMPGLFSGKLKVELPARQFMAVRATLAETIL